MLYCLTVVLLMLTPNIWAQCTTGIQNPGGTYQATTEAGASTINTDARTGQFAYVHVLPSKQYTFTSSVDTDYITITNNSGTQVIAAGLTPLSYVTRYNESIRYYIHGNAQCSTSDQFQRTRRISWRVAPPCLDPVPVNVTNITPISVTLNYTEPSTAPYFGYDAYVSTSSATPGPNVYSASSTTGKMHVTNLNPDTTYHYWLRADCLYQKGEWVYGGTFNTISSLLCNSANYGLHPATTFTPSCTGDFEIFTDQSSRSSTFSNINVVPNTQYTFRTSYGLDYVTITNATGTVVFANGTGGEVSWNSGSYSGVVRFYSHDNAQCGYNVTTLSLRSKYVKCVTTSVTCLPPTNLTISNITSNSARMSWTAPTATPSGYEIYMVTNNTAPGVTTTPTLTSTTPQINVISGLTAGVTYYYWIRSNCGTEKSTWASGGSFVVNASLVCNAATNGLYPEATFTPACTGSAETIVNNAYASEYSNVNIVANRQYTFTSSVFSDYITITNAAGTVVLANGANPLNWSSGINNGVIRYYIHANANCGAQNSNRTKSILCTAPAATCGAPTNLAVSNITSNSCRLTWNAPATAPSSYDIYIITSNTAPTATSTPSATANNAGVGVLNGIDAGTTYYYWIRSNCGTTKSAWVYGGTFATNAALTCNAATHGLYPNATFTPTCTGNSEQIATDAWAGEYSNVNVATNKQYTFSSSVATDYITITNAAGTQVLASGTTPLNWNSGSTSGIIRYHLHANANCGNQNTSRIRSIRCVDTTPTCAAPTQFWSTNITASSATINWIPSTSAPNGGYLFTYNTIQTVGGVNGSSTSTSANLNNLQPNTTYYWWVAANCVNVQSQWAYGGSFTTPAGTATCNAPTQFWSNNITATTAVINWIPATPAPSGGYAYLYNTSPTMGGVDGGSTSTSADLNNLTPNTTYYWWVASSCGSNLSQWAYGGSFTTSGGSAACNPPTQFWSGEIMATTAVVGWTPSTSAPNGGYRVRYNTDMGPGGYYTNSSDAIAELDELTPNTTYHWWVLADCVTSQSQWVYGGSFTTQSAAVAGCWKAIATGMSHTVGIMSDGTLWAWGANDFGQLGDGTRIARRTPVQIGTANDWQSVSAGTLHTMAIKTNGTLWGWGINGNSRLGDDTTTDRIFPAQVGSATNWQSVCAGDTNTLAIKTDGTLWAWGYNGYAQFGDGTMNNRSTPYQIGTATNWKSVDTGNLHTLATKTNGTLWAWGTNTYGQVGDGTTAVRYAPVQIGTETDWKMIAAGANHSVAVKVNGVLYTWGHNQWGQLGDSSNTSRSTPNAVHDQVQNIGAGTDHTVGTTTYGNRFYAGSNTFGQLGDGTNNHVNFIQVTNSNNHALMVSGFHHTVSLNFDGSISICGANGQGQIGNGSTTNSSNMIDITCPRNLSVDDFNNVTNTIKLYPNPAKDIVNITSLEEMSHVSVLNLVGQEVLKKSVQGNEAKLDFSTLPSGTYLVKVTADNWSQTLKVIKQ